MAGSARTSRPLLVAGLCLPIIGAAIGFSSAGGTSKAGAAPLGRGSTSFALAGSVSHADCVTKAWTLIPVASAAGCDYFANPECVPAVIAFTDEQRAASIVIGYPYTTGDPAPNDLTEFAPQIDEACVVLGFARAPSPTPTRTITPTPTPTWTPLPPTPTPTPTPTWTPTRPPLPTWTPTATPTPTPGLVATLTTGQRLDRLEKTVYPAGTPTPGVHMTWALASTVSTDSEAGSTTILQTLSATKGDLLVAVVSFVGNALSSVADNGSGGTNTWSIAYQATAPNTGRGAIAWCVNQCDTGSITVTATFAGSCTYRGLILRDYSGNDASPYDGVNSNAAHQTAGGDADVSGSITPTVAGDLIIGGGYSYPMSAMGTGFGNYLAVTTSGYVVVEDLVRSDTSSVQATFTTTGTVDYAIGVVAFKPAGSVAAAHPLGIFDPELNIQAWR